MYKILFTLVFTITIALNSFHAFAVNTKAQYAILVDNETGSVLFSKNADVATTPSSMTKLMTLYILFDHLKNGVIKLDDEFRVSKKAWSKGGSKMFLRHTERVSVKELIYGIIVQSGNDACITVAEGIAGDENNFVKMMNDKAFELGLTNSHFKNSTGWPDEGHVMSTRDIATLSQKIISDFPKYYQYFNSKEFTHNKITQSNRNQLLWRDIGVDGLKTGHTDDGGYGIAVSALNNGRRQTVVVNGLSSAQERSDEAEKILNYGYRYFTKERLITNGQTFDNVKVWNGTEPNVELAANQDIELIVPKLERDNIKLEIKYKSPIRAPIKKGQKIGLLKVKRPGMEEVNFPLVATEKIDEAGIVTKIFRKIGEYL